MKIISILTWTAPHLAVALVYADAEADLKGEVNGTVLDSGSIAYVGNGSVYVYNGETWTKVGAQYGRQ